MTVVAIHQPNLFPWLGYFDKIARSDVFVFMDDVAYPKSGNSMGSWCNRVKIVVQGSPIWFSCPVVREHGIQLIKNVQIDKNANWKEQRIKTIEYNYKKAPYFNEVYDFIRSLLYYETDKLADYNMNNILAVCDKLEIKCNCIKQSSLETTLNATDLLIEIVHKVGGTSYMCGGGAGGYQEDEKFARDGLGLIYQQFQHSKYKQYGTTDFLSGLSIIDVLMNCGFEDTRSILLGASKL